MKIKSISIAASSAPRPSGTPDDEKKPEWTDWQEKKTDKTKTWSILEYCRDVDWHQWWGPLGSSRENNIQKYDAHHAWGVQAFYFLFKKSRCNFSVFRLLIKMSSMKKRSDLIDSVDYFRKNNSPFTSALSFSRRCRFVILDHCSNDNDDID